MKKQKIVCLICLVLGVVVAYGSSYGGQFKQVVNFVGAMMITGSFIFIDEWLMNKIFKEKRNKAIIQLRLLIYIGIGILLLNLPLISSENQQWIYSTKAFGISFLILSMWKFYSFTSLNGVSHKRSSGCDGTGDCSDCGRSDICSIQTEEKIK